MFMDKNQTQFKHDQICQEISASCIIIYASAEFTK